MDIKNFEEKQISSENIFDGKVVHLRFDRILLPNGKEATREYIKHVGAVCVLPVTDEGEAVCVRQYRYPLSRVVTEIPAGKLDSPDEDPLEAAIRELREETGCVAEKMTFMGKFYSSPAILDECIYMYLAEGLEFGETDFDEDEFLDTVKIPIDELAQMIADGEIIDGKTQVAVLKAIYIINKRRNEEKKNEA